MNYWIDRIEGDLAICENEQGHMIPIPTILLPDTIREGDGVREADGCYTIDIETTKIRRQQVHDKMNRLFID